MRIITDRETFRSTATEAAETARVPVELRLRADPFEAYRRARRGDSGDFFLETSGGQSGWGYFGTAPIQRLTVGSDAVPLEGGDPPPLSALDAILRSETLERGDCETPYPCGIVGWLSYDVARELESLPDTTDDDRDLPRLQMAKYDRLVAWREPHAGVQFHPESILTDVGQEMIATFCRRCGGR